MNLLVVSTWLPYPPDNGSRIRAYHLLKELAKRHDITLLTFADDWTEDQLTPLRAVCRRVEVVRQKARAPLGFRGLLSATPRHYAQTENPLMHEAVRRALPGHDAALAFQGDAARYLAAEAAIPCVFDEVEVALFREAYENARRPAARLRAGLTWWKFRRFVRSLVSSFDRVTVVSTTERDHLREIGCDTTRIVVVPNGIDLPAVPPAAERLPRLVYPGSVTYSANLDAVRFFVRDVFPRVRQHRPDLSLWVTGETKGVVLDDLASVDGVHFTGRLPEVESVIAESVACVVPLRVGGGTRLKVLQALALGTPVVATSKGVEGLQIEPGRQALVADDPGSFAEMVLHIAGDARLSRELTEEGLHFVQRYAWEPIGDVLEAALQDARREHHRDRNTDAPVIHRPAVGR